MRAKNAYLSGELNTNNNGVEGAGGGVVVVADVMERGFEKGADEGSKVERFLDTRRGEDRRGEREEGSVRGKDSEKGKREKRVGYRGKETSSPKTGSSGGLGARAAHKRT